VQSIPDVFRGLHPRYLPELTRFLTGLKVTVLKRWIKVFLTDIQDSLQFLAYTKKAYFVEFNVSTGEISRQLAKNPISMKDGYVEIPNQPGTGIEVDESVLEKYRVL